jgi:hypothetical protein
VPTPKPAPAPAPKQVEPKKTWQQEIGEESIRKLHTAGILQDVEEWCKKDLTQPIEMWTVFTLLSRMI